MIAVTAHFVRFALLVVCTTLRRIIALDYDTKSICHAVAELLQHFLDTAAAQGEDAHALQQACARFLPSVASALGPHRSHPPNLARPKRCALLPANCQKTWCLLQEEVAGKPGARCLSGEAEEVMSLCRWPELRVAMVTLAESPDPSTRTALAGALHRLAPLVGSTAAASDILPITTVRTISTYFTYLIRIQLYPLYRPPLTPPLHLL